MNLLIVRLSSMGDVIHTLPALRMLRRTFPDATLGWVVEDSHADLLRGHPDLDHLFVLSRKQMKSGWVGWLRSVRQLRRQLAPTAWDWTIDFQGLWKSFLITRCARAKRTLGYAPSHEHTHWFYSDRLVLPTMERHAVDRNLDLLAPLGCPRPQSVPVEDFQLPLTDQDHQFAGQVLLELGLDSQQPIVFLNFSARKPANRWPLERFGELAVRLLDTGRQVVLTGGPADIEAGEALVHQTRHPIPSLVGRCTLRQTAAVLQRGTLMVTGDTGPMHLAVCAGLPVVALFGPANPLRTGPYSSKATILQKDCYRQPCYARRCPLGMPAPCMQSIAVDEVFKSITNLSRQVESADATSGVVSEKPRAVC